MWNLLGLPKKRETGGLPVTLRTYTSPGREYGAFNWKDNLQRVLYGVDEILKMPRNGTVSVTTKVLGCSIRFGRIRDIEAYNLLLTNSSSTLFFKSFEFLPHLESLTLDNIKGEERWFAKLANGLAKRRRTCGRLARLRVDDARARAATKEIHSLGDVFKNGCIIKAYINVGHHLSSMERQLIRHGIEQCVENDGKQLVSILADNTNLFYEDDAPRFRNRFPCGKISTRQRFG